jgi:two-component system cell cycle sensor histidine kinase/response regulator CckA
LNDLSTQPVLSRATVLVVEDEGTVRLMVVDSLREQGYSVLEVRTGDQAANLLRGGALMDLVFTDVRMPGPIDGIMLAQIINSEFPAIKVIIASGHISSLPAGLADGLFNKPYDLTSVALEIEKLLEAQAGIMGSERTGNGHSADWRPFELAAE